MGKLKHSGRKGQKWYERNGPPYPLGSDQLSSVERKNGGVSKSAKERDGGQTTKSASDTSTKDYKKNAKNLNLDAETSKLLSRDKDVIKSLENYKKQVLDSCVWGYLNSRVRSGEIPASEDESKYVHNKYHKQQLNKAEDAYDDVMYKLMNSSHIHDHEMSDFDKMDFVDDLPNRWYGNDKAWSKALDSHPVYMEWKKTGKFSGYDYGVKHSRRNNMSNNYYGRERRRRRDLTQFGIKGMKWKKRKKKGFFENWAENQAKKQRMSSKNVKMINDLNKKGIKKALSKLNISKKVGMLKSALKKSQKKKKKSGWAQNQAKKQRMSSKNVKMIKGLNNKALKKAMSKLRPSRSGAKKAIKKASSSFNKRVNSARKRASQAISGYRRKKTVKGATKGAASGIRNGYNKRNQSSSKKRYKTKRGGAQRKHRVESYTGEKVIKMPWER